MNENEIATRIVDCAYKTHVDLGPGLFESVYQEVLSKKLENVGLTVKKEIDIPITYEELSFKKALWQGLKHLPSTGSQA